MAKCPDANGRQLTISEEQTEESLQINGSCTFQLDQSASYLYTAFPEITIFETQNEACYVFPTDPSSNFYQRFIALG